MSYHDSMKGAIDRQMTDDPDWASVYYRTLKRLEQGFYDQEWVDVIFQKYEGFIINIYDAAFFSQSWILMGACELLYCKAQVGEPPGSDEDIAGNNNKLKNLPPPFRATFSPGKGAVIGDGQLNWNMDLEVGMERGGKHFGPVVIAPGQATLEVGFTRATTTWYILNHQHFLARWPYFSEWIYLLYKNPKDSPLGIHG